MLVEWPDNQKQLYDIVEGIAKIKGKPTGEYLAQLVRSFVDSFVDSDEVDRWIARRLEEEDKKANEVAST